MTTATMATGTRTAESELRAAARRRGLTMKELAAMMGVSAGYLSQIANGGRPWTPKMREKVAAVLGRGPRAGDRLPPGRRRHRGEQLHQGARTHPGHDHAGPGRADRWRVLRLHDAGCPWPPEHMGVKVQVRVESALHAPAKVAPGASAPTAKGTW